MGERTGLLYSALSRPSVYRAFKRLVGADPGRRRFVVDHVRPFPGARVLDVGCGLAEIAPDLGDAEYTGVEPNPKYVDAAREHLGPRARVLLGGIEQLSELAQPPYDRILFVGVLHHLSDDLIARHTQELSQWLAPDGSLIALEPTLFAAQGWRARALIRRDRGEHVRSPGEYAEIFRPAFSEVRIFLRSDLLRVPYSNCIIEASTCAAR